MFFKLKLSELLGGNSCNKSESEYGFLPVRKMIAILKFILVLIILVAMIIILLGINHLFSGNFSSSEKETSDFRREVREGDDVMSSHNLFHQFLDKGKR